MGIRAASSLGGFLGVLLACLLNTHQSTSPLPPSLSIMYSKLMNAGMKGLTRGEAKKRATYLYAAQLRHTRGRRMVTCGWGFSFPPACNWLLQCSEWPILVHVEMPPFKKGKKKEKRARTFSAAHAGKECSVQLSGTPIRPILVANKSPTHPHVRHARKQASEQTGKLVRLRLLEILRTRWTYSSSARL